MAKVTALEWPGNSSDLNHIENMWEVMKRMVADKQLSSASALVDAIWNVWIKEISVEYWQNFIFCMFHHIQAVLQNKGGYTKYWLCGIFWIFNVGNVVVVYHSLRTGAKLEGGPRHLVMSMHDMKVLCIHCLTVGFFLFSTVCTMQKYGMTISVPNISLLGNVFLVYILLF